LPVAISSKLTPVLTSPDKSCDYRRLTRWASVGLPPPVETLDLHSPRTTKAWRNESHSHWPIDDVAPDAPPSRGSRNSFIDLCIVSCADDE
jgi:hypothetical protein